MYFSKIKEVVLKNQKVIIGALVILVVAFAAKKAYEKYVENKAAEGFSEITFEKKTVPGEEMQSVSDRMTEVVYDVSGHGKDCNCGEFSPKHEDTPLVEVPAFDSGASQSAFIEKIYSKSEESVV